MASALMERYIASLPNGLDSYPSCQIKSSVLRGFLATVDAARLSAELPQPLLELATHPPPPSEWISEVRATAIFVASGDTVFDRSSFIEHAYRTNYTLLDSTMYRILFRLVGARRVLTNVSSSWAQFHRGTTLTLTHFDETAKNAAVGVSFPAHHVPALLADGYATAIRAAIEISGHKQVSSAIEHYSPVRAEIVVRWS